MRRRRGVLVGPVARHHVGQHRGLQPPLSLDDGAGRRRRRNRRRLRLLPVPRDHTVRLGHALKGS